MAEGELLHKTQYTNTGTCHDTRRFGGQRNDQFNKGMERYAKPAASAGVLGLRERPVQAAGSNLSGSVA
jgi:hypothetical protein